MRIGITSTKNSVRIDCVVQELNNLWMLGRHLRMVEDKRRALAWSTPLGKSISCYVPNTLTNSLASRL
jgi:hypothetical protein